MQLYPVRLSSLHACQYIRSKKANNLLRLIDHLNMVFNQYFFSFAAEVCCMIGQIIVEVYQRKFLVNKAIVSYLSGIHLQLHHENLVNSMACCCHARFLVLNKVTKNSANQVDKLDRNSYCRLFVLVVILK